MSETPPPQYAAYPRNTPQAYGSADKLEALSDGYYGLNWVFVATIVLSLVARVIITTNPDSVWGVIVVLFLIEAGMTYPFNKKIGYGKGWSEATVIVSSLLMGLNVFCCGIIGFVIMQSIAAKEIKLYGVKSGFLGFKRKDVQAAIANLREAERVPRSPQA